MESATKVMLAIAAIIGAGVATAVVLVVVMRTPPLPDTGEVTLLLSIRDSGGATKSKFNPGEPIVIELSLINGKSYTVLYEGGSCIATPTIMDSYSRQVTGFYCPGDYVNLEIPPGPYRFIGSVTWDQTCQSDCGGTGWGTQVPPGEYTVTGRLQGSVNGQTLEVVDRIQIS